MNNQIKSLIYKLGSTALLKNLFLPFKGKAGVLCFHRVVDENTFMDEKSPQKNLLITKNNFNDQMEFISNNYEVISIDSLEEHLNSNSKEFKIVITFDDGYRDNKDMAIPILEKYNLPATIYIVTRFLEGDYFMWWYELWEIVNREKWLKFKYLNKLYKLNCNNMRNILNSYNYLMKIFIKSSYDTQINLITQLRMDKERLDYESLVMTKNDIIQLSNNKNITLGSHTHNHLSLKYLNSNIVKFELENSKNILEKLIKKKVSHFCYPYGSKTDFGDRDKKLIKEVGYETATQTETYKLNSKYDNLEIPRISIRNVNHKILASKLNGIDNFLYSLFK